MDYSKDIEIDQSALDVEWLEQPRLMFKYAKMCAEAKRNLDLTKERLDVIRAEVDRKVRSDPKEYGITKITESGVANTILTVPEYQAASRDLIEAKYEFEMARAAVSSVEQRKDSLENLVRLHGQQYFAGPSIPRDLSKEWQQRQAQRNSDAEAAAAFRANRLRRR